MSTRILQETVVQMRFSKPTILSGGLVMTGNPENLKRFRVYPSVTKRAEVNFDIFWLKDGTLEESANISSR